MQNSLSAKVRDDLSKISQGVEFVSIEIKNELRKI